MKERGQSEDQEQFRCAIRDRDVSDPCTTGQDHFECRHGLCRARRYKQKRPRDPKRPSSLRRRESPSTGSSVGTRLRVPPRRPTEIALGYRDWPEPDSEHPVGIAPRSEVAPVNPETFVAGDEDDIEDGGSDPIEAAPATAVLPPGHEIHVDDVRLVVHQAAPDTIILEDSVSSVLSIAAVEPVTSPLQLGPAAETVDLGYIEAGLTIEQPLTTDAPQIVEAWGGGAEIPQPMDGDGILHISPFPDPLAPLDPAQAPAPQHPWLGTL